MATINMESSKVIQGAKDTIKHILDTREARDEKRIAICMEKKFFSFRRGFYKPTREEAINLLDADDSFMFWGWHSQYAHEDLSKAKTLLIIAKHGDPVTLNEDDTRVLFGWHK